jgi:hypothetical protein
VLAGLVGCSCNAALALSQYIVGVLSNASQLDANNVLLDAVDYSSAWLFVSALLAFGCALAVVQAVPATRQLLSRKRRRSVDVSKASTFK